jgi:hypothetical protein
LVAVCGHVCAAHEEAGVTFEVAEVKNLSLLRKVMIVGSCRRVPIASCPVRVSFCYSFLCSDTHLWGLVDKI